MLVPHVNVDSVIGLSLQDRIRRIVFASRHAHFGNVGVEPGSNDRADQVLVRRVAGNLGFAY